MNVREWALPVYTILIQIAAGILLMLWIIRLRSHSKLSREKMHRMMDTPITIVFFTIVFAVIGAHFHLSKPYLSLLSILNFRYSWLSREIVFTILFLIFAGSLFLLQRKKNDHTRIAAFTGWVAILCGWTNIYCMARIYLLPTQVAWNLPSTIAYYFVTTLLLGSMATAAILIMDLRFTEVRESQAPDYRIPLIQNSLAWLAVLATIMVITVIWINLRQISHLQNADQSAITSLNLLLGLYRPLLFLRLGLIVFGVIFLIHSTIQMTWKRKTVRDLLVPIYGACLLVMVGEILGRFLFYATHIRVGI